MQKIDREQALAFRALLRKGMQLKGIKTQEQLAEAAGVSQSLISMFFVGLSPYMRALELFKVLHALDIEPNEVARIFD